MCHTLCKKNHIILTKNPGQNQELTGAGVETPIPEPGSRSGPGLEKFHGKLWKHGKPRIYLSSKLERMLKVNVPNSSPVSHWIEQLTREILKVTSKTSSRARKQGQYSRNPNHAP